MQTILSVWFVGSNEFQLIIGSQAIENWEGKDVVLPPYIEIWGHLPLPCLMACSTPDKNIYTSSYKNKAYQLWMTAIDPCFPGFLDDSVNI